MKPDVDRLLEVAAMELIGRVGPALPTRYQQSSTAALGAMLLATREEFERGAARRIEENEAIRGLFAESLAVVEDAALRDRLEAAAREGDEDLTIGALEAGNATLRGLLIELHRHVEELDTPAAERLDQAIWDELVASTERRRLGLALF
ncbi:MAG: hypothetical protein ACR2P8_12070 [Myxococcota bacterium]